MKILVTGAAGLLGSRVSAALVAKGAQVRAVDFIEPSVDGAENLAVDAADPSTCIEVSRDVQRIAHLGAFHGVHLERNRGPKSEADFFSANIAGTFHMLHAAVENGVGSFTWASSTVVYERGSWRIYGIYSLSKVVGEELCQFFNREHGLRVIGIRYGTFGSEDFLETGFGMLGTIMHGNMIRTEEVVNITLAAIENDTIDFGMYDAQTPLPFAPADEWAYMQGRRVEVLSKYWPEHRSLIKQHESRLPPTINTVRMERTLRDLDVTVEHDFGWFLEELSRREG